jgi:hypothetical protein
LIRIQLNPTIRQLRQFAGVWIGFCAILGLALYLKGGPTKAMIAWIAGLAGVPGLFFPAIMKPLYLLLTYATFPIGLVVSHIVMAAVFYLVFTPVAVIMKMLGRDLLERKFDPHASSYWRPVKSQTDLESYFRQY